MVLLLLVTTAGCATAEPAPATIDDLAGAEWVLQRFAADEPAPKDPPITLALKDGRVAGASGCNRYFGTPTSDPDRPGSIQIGPIGATRMACPEEIMALEMRFLAALERATRIGIEDGKLHLAWSDDAESGVLVFERRAQENP